MNTQNDRKRLFYSMVTSFCIHMSILILIAILGITYISVFSKNKKEDVVYKIDYLPKEVIVYSNPGSEFHQEDTPLKDPTDKLIVEDTSEDEHFVSNHEIPKFSEINLKSLDDKYEVTTVHSSPIKVIQKTKSFENIDFNSENFEKCASKMSWNSERSFQTLNEIKDYYNEIHIIRFCPGKKDCIVVDSYIKKTYHVSFNTTIDDLKKYPLSAKFVSFNDFSQLPSFSQAMISSVGASVENYDRVLVLMTKQHWIQLFTCFEKFLSKYNLSLNDDKVKNICVRYIKKGKDYTIEVENATIEKDGKIIQINN